MPQEERRERQLSQETNFHRSLCELQHTVMNYVDLTCQGRKKSQATSPNQEQENERWRNLNSEWQGQAEYDQVTRILKQQKELLQQQESNQGKDTSLTKLLLDLLRYLWKYFLFYPTRRGTLRPNFTSLCQHREWRNFCQQNTTQERGTTLKQHVRMLIYYLKQSIAGWRAEDSQAARCKEDTNFVDFASPAL
ncbi:hypothetical protein ACROYT_G012001 [Oculina patagonica]